MKGTCIHDRALLDCIFEKDDGSLSQIGSAKKYVETWPERRANNDGLLLWGGVGTGKTFYAACIANVLIEEGVSVLMTNLSKILNQLSGMYSEDKNHFIVTTNLSLETMKNPADIAHQRIYDRVLVMCIPISFQGENHRKADTEKKFKNGKCLFEDEGDEGNGNEME